MTAPGVPVSALWWTPGRALATYFALAYGISWGIWAPLWLPALGVGGLPVVPFHHALGAVGPISAAFIVAALAGGRPEAAALGRSLVAWRGRRLWLAVSVLGPAGVMALAVILGAALGGGEFSWAGVGVSREFPQFSVLTFFVYNLVTFGIGEETGWRGFALPRLQRGRSALAATGWLTLGWAGWHAPLFLYRPGYVAMGLADIVGWGLSLFTGAILLTWLFNASRGSVLVVALFHAAIDVVFTSDVASEAVVMATGVLVTLWGLGVLLVAKPRTLAGRHGTKVTDLQRVFSPPR